MISVIVIAHNIVTRSERIIGMTKTCLETLHDTADSDYELLTIDNGSHDELMMSAMISDFNKTLGHVPSSLWINDRNEPIAKIWNEAIARSTGDIVMLLNNDIVFHKKGWMSAMAAPLYRPSIGIVGSKLMSWNGFQFVEGAFITFRKSEALAIAEDGKIFDERFDFTCEEVDFCRRMERYGKQLLAVDVESKGYATHLHHGTLCWSNDDNDGKGGAGGWNGRSILEVMHESRRKLCRKYNMPERVDD